MRKAAVSCELSPGHATPQAMISIVIPTLNAERGLVPTFTALVPGVVAGVVREVIVCDGGSSDATIEIAEAAGATIIRCGAGRGQQLIEGARGARSDWLLFLHADTVLEPGWERDVEAFMERVDAGRRPEAAAAFQFALDDLGFRPRLLESLVNLRCIVFSLPYGDQGLLLPRRLYDAIGGFKPMPLMEDVDFVRRLGRRRLVMLRSKAVTGAMRYKRDGYLRRVARNLSCLALYYVGVPLRRIVKLYG